MCAECERKALLMEYFNCVSTEDYVTASFRSIEHKRSNRIVLHARHHKVHPTERKFGLVQKNIQRWFKNFADGDFEQISIAK